MLLVFPPTTMQFELFLFSISISCPMLQLHHPPPPPLPTGGAGAGADSAPAPKPAAQRGQPAGRLPPARTQHLQRATSTGAAARKAGARWRLGQGCAPFRCGARVLAACQPLVRHSSSYAAGRGPCLGSGG